MAFVAFFLKGDSGESGSGDGAKERKGSAKKAKATEKEVRTSEDSDVEDVYSSNAEAASQSVKKKKKLCKNRRLSRSFSENKGDETESESDEDGTPRSSLRSNGLKLLATTNGTLASTSSNSSSEEVSECTTCDPSTQAFQLVLTRQWQERKAASEMYNVKMGQEHYPALTK